MINVTALIQLKAFARQDGAILVLFWIASFLSYMYSPETSWGYLFMISTPFVVCWRMVKFRNYALGGQMSYRRAFAYSCYVFFYAAIVFALVQYVYFRFIDQGQMNTFIMESMRTVEPFYKQQGMSDADIAATRDMMTDMSPLYKAFIFMMANMLQGFIASFVLALVGMKRKASPTHSQTPPEGSGI